MPGIVVARGFKAIKLNGCEEMQIVDSWDKVEKAVETIATIREAVGPYIGIGVDFHGRVHKPMAKVLAKELDPYKLMFIEEPVLSENQEALRDIVNHTSTPIALGERLYSRWDFKQVLSDGFVDIIQPDLSHAGGITECRKIAAMAEAYDVALAPHCPLGPIALAACLQVDAVSYNAFIQEQSLGIHYNKSNDILDYISNKEVFQYADGYRRDPAGTRSRHRGGRGLCDRARQGRPSLAQSRSGVMKTAALPSGEIGIETMTDRLKGKRI